jgi:hypothetical protein
MSEYMFGLGPGWLPDEADDIAKKHGAGLVNYTDAQCNCGHGCPPHTCEKSRRHWFAGPNRGNPFDQDMAEAVLNEVYAAEMAGDFDAAT